MVLMSQKISASDGLTMKVLSDGHALVTIEQDQRYILLPIEDAAPETNIRIMVGGRLEEIINVRLAQNHIDYYVPLDTRRFEGSHVVLDVRAEMGRDGLRSIKGASWSKNIKLTDSFDKSNQETKWRPVYHHTPRYAWMNDPNGMFYRDGVWHLCYQYGPYGSTWNNMT